MRAFLVIALLAVGTSCAHRPAIEPAPAGEPRLVGYLASWGVRTKGTRIAELPADRLTHIIYAFGRITPDGVLALADPCLDVARCSSPDSVMTPGGNFQALRELKARHPGLRLLLAIGGWTGSGRFSDVALTPESRSKFVASTLDLAIRSTGGLFDGVDIDWEYPVRGGLASNAKRPEDRQNFAELLREFRRKLSEQGTRDGRRYELTIATVAGPWVSAQMSLDGHFLPRTAGDRRSEVKEERRAQPGAGDTSAAGHPLASARANLRAA